MSMLGGTPSISTVIVAWFVLIGSFPAAVFAQAVRMELHPLPTTTLSDREFLTGIILEGDVVQKIQSFLSCSFLLNAIAMALKKRGRSCRTCLTNSRQDLQWVSCRD